jgi:hypothetical protein
MLHAEHILANQNIHKEHPSLDWLVGFLSGRRSFRRPRTEQTVGTTRRTKPDSTDSVLPFPLEHADAINPNNNPMPAKQTQ